MDRQQIGRAAEDAAVEFLQSEGLAILLRNFRRRLGELDVVARERDVLVIVEVRTRVSESYGGAAGSVGFRKQQRILRTTTQLLQQRADLTVFPIRFDVIVVRDPFAQTPQIEWIKHAFSA
jgi:putative endonuclease